MHISRTDLNLFVIFEAIYSQGGVTRAAETLNLSQPTISHALARLRERVDDPLFVRKGQSLMPTPAAQKMIGPVREALKLFERTLGELDGFDPTTAQMSFSLGMRSLMESTYLLPLVLQLKETAPGVSIGSCTFDRRRLESVLASGEVNAVIDVFLPASPEIRREHLGASPTVVIARKNHPLLKGGIDLESYIAADHVIVTSRPQGQGPEDIALSRVGKHRRIVARCQQINTAMRLVASSDMLLTMAEAFALRANTSFDNQLVAAPFKTEGVDTYLYWHDNADADPANRWFRSMVRATVTQTADI